MLERKPLLLHCKVRTHPCPRVCAEHPVSNLRKLCFYVTLIILCHGAIQAADIDNGKDVPHEENSVFIPSHGWPRVLVINASSGWRHDSIEPATDMMIGHANVRNWNITITSNVDEHITTSAALRQYDVIVFLTNTGSIFSWAQREAFKGYIEEGGAVAGVHSGGADTNRDWSYFKDVFGATLAGHPDVQRGVITTEDESHPTTSFLPKNWDIEEEFYNYNEPFTLEGKHVLISVNETSYSGGAHGNFHPISWTRLHPPADSRVWYCALGHTRNVYTGNDWPDLQFQKHVALGVEWAASGTSAARNRILSNDRHE